MKMMKKASLTATQIITIVLLIVGFVIVLFLYWQLSWTGRIDRDACHQSVIMRATLPTFGGVAEFVPLKCKTEKFCITTGFFGGKCENQFGKERVTRVKVKSKTEIEKLISQEMLECWSMMGEGKITVFSQWFAQTYGLGRVYPTCVICSRIAFDENVLNEKVKDWKEIDPLYYMGSHKLPGKDITYYEYLAGEGGKISINQESLETSIFEPLANDLAKSEGWSGVKDNLNMIGGMKKAKEELEKAGKEGGLKDEGIYESEEDKYKGKELTILFMQISAPEHLDSLENIGKTLGAGAAGSFLVAPITTGNAAWTLGKGILAHPIIAAIAVIAGVSVQQYSVAWNRAVTAGYCGDVSVGSEASSGCSVVRLVDYDARDIAMYCQEIASIP